MCENGESSGTPYNIEEGMPAPDRQLGAKMSEELKMPRHVAIILDGNGRWAKAKGMPRNYGHVQGAKTVETICEEAYRMGIQYLTVYAFSTENWNRPREEVEALMKLLRNYMKTCLKTAEKNRMCVRVLGEKSRLDEDIRSRIRELEEATRNTGPVITTVFIFRLPSITAGGMKSSGPSERLPGRPPREGWPLRTSPRRRWRGFWIRRDCRNRICSSAPAAS